MNKKLRANNPHPYHLVDPSPWPILISLTLLSLGLGLVQWLTLGEANLIPQLMTTLLIAIAWFRDIMREGMGGYHTEKVQRSLMIGFLVFLATEVMLFISFFWAFFASSLNPGVEIGSVWPPVGIEFLDCWSIPLLGSIVLLSSGFILTLAHHLFLSNEKSNSLLAMILSVILGFAFVYIQYIEYSYSEFTISDSILGSVFYLTTGLHAIHVIIGALLLGISTIRIYLDQITVEHNLGYTFAIYYYHLVDVIWLFVFFVYYWWGA